MADSVVGQMPRKSLERWAGKLHKERNEAEAEVKALREGKKVYIVYRLNDDGIEAHISFVTASKKKAEAAAKGQNGWTYYREHELE